MKLGAAQNKTPAGWRLVRIQVAVVAPPSPLTQSQESTRGVGAKVATRRTNLTESDPVKLEEYALLLFSFEKAF